MSYKKVEVLDDELLAELFEDVKRDYLRTSISKEDIKKAWELIKSFLDRRRKLLDDPKPYKLELYSREFYFGSDIKVKLFYNPEDDERYYKALVLRKHYKDWISFDFMEDRIQAVIRFVTWKIADIEESKYKDREVENE